MTSLFLLDVIRLIFYLTLFISYDIIVLKKEGVDMNRLMVVYETKDKTFIDVPEGFDYKNPTNFLSTIREAVRKIDPKFDSLIEFYNAETGEQLYED